MRGTVPAVYAGELGKRGKLTLGPLLSVIIWIHFNILCWFHFLNISRCYSCTVTCTNLKDVLDEKFYVCLHLFNYHPDQDTDNSTPHIFLIPSVVHTPRSNCSSGFRYHRFIFIFVLNFIKMESCDMYSLSAFFLLNITSWSISINIVGSKSRIFFLPLCTISKLFICSILDRHLFGCFQCLAIMN